MRSSAAASRSDRESSSPLPAFLVAIPTPSSIATPEIEAAVAEIIRILRAVTSLVAVAGKMKHRQPSSVVAPNSRRVGVGEDGRRKAGFFPSSIQHTFSFFAITAVYCNMVSELAGEGAMPLPTPASRRLEIAHHQWAVEEKPIEDVLSFPILLSDQIKDAIKEDDSFKLECSDDEEDRHNLIGDSEQRNGARSPGRSSFAIDGSKNRFVNPARFNFSCRKRFFPSIASNSSRSRSVKIASRMLVNPLFTVFNRNSRSRSVRSSAELVIPLFDLVSLSKVLVISLFTVFIRSRSAEILSTELVAVASSPQRRTRKKKQLLTQIRDSGSRSVEFVNQPSVIDSACVGRSLAIQNLAMVCRLPYVNLFFAYVNRLRRGEQPVLDSDFACVDCNRVSAEQQVEAEPIKEELENPLGKSTKSKKVKAGLSQYTIQKFVEEKQKTLKNAKNLNSEFAEFVEGAALHESPKDAADFSLIPEAVDDYQFGDSNEKFVFPFLPSSDRGGLPDLSFVSSGIASDIYSAGISSTYQCHNSEAKIPVETEMAIKHLRQVRNQVMNSTDVDLQSKRLMDAVIDVSAEVLWFTRKEEMLRLPMLKKCLLFLLWILAVFFDSLTAWMKGMVFLGVHSMDAS
nr:GPI-anchored adhesin-like protein precursor [Ipomoea batatas]